MKESTILAAIAVLVFLAGGCEKHVVWQDGIMFENVSLGKTYTERIPWRITLLEIDQTNQKCLFDIENIEQETKYSQWLREGERFSLGEKNEISRIVLHRVEKGRAVLGIPFGRVYETYRLK